MLRKHHLIGLLSLALVATLALPAAADAVPVTRRGGAEYSGNVIVAYKPGMRASALSAARQLDAVVLDTTLASRFEVVRPAAGVSAIELAAALNGKRGVDYAYRERILHAAYTPPDDLYAKYQWNMPLISMPAAWNVTRPRHAGAKIAIIDTGVQATHIDLKYWPPSGGWDAIHNDFSPFDDNGHGTHVAGVMLAKIANKVNGVYAGVAGITPDSTMYVYKALDANGNGFESVIAQGVDWAVAKGADVINLSVASQDYPPTLSAAIRNAASAGVYVVAAAGNEGTNLLSYPGALPEVLSVGAIDRNRNHWQYSNVAPELDLAAPGVNVWSTVFNPAHPTQKDWYAPMTGTSMAAPHAAGAAALYVGSQHVSAPNGYAAMRTSALDLGSTGADNLYGWGLVNAFTLLTAPTPQAVRTVPGLAIPASSFPATLAPSSPAVYEMHVRADQQVTISTESTVAAWVRVLDRDARDVSATPLAAGTPGTTSEVTFSATSSGGYHIVIEAAALAEPANVTVSYSIADSAGADNDIPGVALSPSPVSGHVDRAGDADDIYSVHLGAGQGIIATLNGTSPDFDPQLFNADLYLYDPSATSINTIPPTIPVAGAATAGWPEKLTYSVPPASDGGTYALDVFAYAGTGAYALNWDVAPGTLLTMTAPATCSWGGSATLRGRLSQVTSGDPVTLQLVDVYARPYGSSWRRVGQASTSATGEWTLAVKPTKRTYYVAQYAGQTAIDPKIAGTESAIGTITPKAYLTAPRTRSSTVTHGRYFSAWGYLRPYHRAGAKSVRIYAYRLQSGKWVKKRTYYPVNYRYTSTTTRYAGRISLPYSGRWKLVASIPGDTVHVTTTSSAKYLRAR